MSPFGKWLQALLGLGAAAIAGCYTPTVTRTQSYHPSDADVSVTRIVHGSAVIEFPETRILLDPWYSPTPPLGPSEPIGLSLENLPPMRGMLITHKHDDHFDAQTLREFPNKSLRVVVRRGLAAELARMGYSDVVELEDWETAQIGGVVVTAVPARHRAAENGYVLQGNSVTLYVAGDTSYDAELFRTILARFQRLDAALLPIGGIRILSRRLDMTPEEAAEAYAILKPGHLIPYHYGLTGPMPFVTAAANPVKRLYEAMGKGDKAAQRAIIALEPGQSWHHYR